MSRPRPRMGGRLKLAVALGFLLAPAPAAALDFQILESGDFSPLRARMDGLAPGSPGRKDLEAVIALYQGDLDRAGSLFAPDSPARDPGVEWLRTYAAAVSPLRRGMTVSESEHFILRTPPGEDFLARYALDALEKAYGETGKDLGLRPEGKVPVDIYGSEEDFSLASTLTREDLDRSGAIGICKFRRLMILSPRRLAFGYRWLDTLAHEYVHYVINAKSRGLCPLWLHEGIARYLDTRWRLAAPQYLIPGNRTELARALKKDGLVPFSRMEPSMVYLDGQEQVRLAFSQVSHAVHMIVATEGPSAIREILEELAGGRSRAEAFRKVLGRNDEQFEKDWKVFLAEEDLAESPGAAPDAVRFGQADEIDQYVGVGLRGHIRLGDRLRRKGLAEAALVQYGKAAGSEPFNPVALTNSARALLALGRGGQAVDALKVCVRENPNYLPAFLLLGQEMERAEEFGEALRNYRECAAINPFDPRVHEGIVRAAEALGLKEEAERSREILRKL